MRRLWFIAVLCLPLLCVAQTPANTWENVVVAKEATRFGGWPANHGIWSWGDEIVVGFQWGYYKESPTGGHDIDRDRPSVERQARSLDGGKTWTIEDPSASAPDGKESAPSDPPGGIDFTHPDFALKFRMSTYYYSLDRCKTWQGPYVMPSFGQPELLARTDYMVEGKHQLMAFLAAAKDDGAEGWPLCARTTDGGKTWERVGWIGAQPGRGDYAIMPSALRLSDNGILCMIRRRGTLDDQKQWWIEPYLSYDNGAHWYLLKRPFINNAGNPPHMIRLKDGRIALTYGHRLPPYGIRARISADEGITWSQEIILRDDGASWDLGYPRMVQRPDGKCVTVYYFHGREQEERYIAATIWDPAAAELE
ncbi:MAG: exo-alpha-sialidase [Candidatus Hydrogenedentes bacterium]|nr:exo-alpha-sialidase [Candidatus Hydrogenedentota bacterium]